MVSEDSSNTERQSGLINSSRKLSEKHHNLATGGLVGSTQKNLWLITASARAYQDENDTEGYNVPATNISIGAFGHLDANGQIWVALSDNDPTDATPK